MLANNLTRRFAELPAAVTGRFNGTASATQSFPEAMAKVQK